jgi:hypothetical protein
VLTSIIVLDRRIFLLAVAATGHALLEERETAARLLYVPLRVVCLPIRGQVARVLTCIGRAEPSELLLRLQVLLLVKADLCMPPIAAPIVLNRLHGYPGAGQWVAAATCVVEVTVPRRERVAVALGAGRERVLTVARVLD